MAQEYNEQDGLADNVIKDAGYNQRVFNATPKLYAGINTDPTQKKMRARIYPGTQIV